VSLNHTRSLLKTIRLLRNLKSLRSLPHKRVLVKKSLRLWLSISSAINCQDGFQLSLKHSSSLLNKTSIYQPEFWKTCRLRKECKWSPNNTTRKKRKNLKRRTLSKRSKWEARAKEARRDKTQALRKKRKERYLSLWLISLVPRTSNSTISWLRSTSQRVNRLLFRDGLKSSKKQVHDLYR